MGSLAFWMSQDLLPRLSHECEISHFSGIQLCETAWTAAYQAPLSMGFSRQEYWSGLPWFDLGIKPESLMSPPLASGFFTTSATWEAPSHEQYLLEFCPAAA